MKTFSVTDIGKRRDMNQDYFFTSEMPVGNLPNLFIVADGMGGHNAGEFASKHAVDCVIAVAEQLEETEPIKILEKAIKKANEEIYQLAEEKPFMKGMGTTIVACVVEGKKLYVANVGDSRLYIINRGIRQVTWDHSLVEEMVRLGEMDKETAREHPDRNIITRAVGAEKDVEIDFFEEEIDVDDEILLCSDGLTNMLEDEEIRRIVRSQRDVAEITEKLVLKANQNGGKDNITVVVIHPFSDEVNGKM